MPLVGLKLGTIHRGRVVGDIDRALERALRDLNARIDVKGKREVALKLTLEPTAVSDGQVTAAQISYSIDEKLPKDKKSPEMALFDGTTGTFHVSDVSADARQMDVEDELARRRNSESGIVKAE